MVVKSVDDPSSLLLSLSPPRLVCEWREPTAMLTIGDKGKRSARNHYILQKELAEKGMAECVLFIADQTEELERETSHTTATIIDSLQISKRAAPDPLPLHPSPYPFS